MKRVIFALFVAAVTAAIMVPLAFAGGNSSNAKACQQGGWQNLARTEDGRGFANQDECVTYGAHGGQLTTKPAPPAAKMCSVTIRYMQGIDTILYGVNGYTETPITHDVTVTSGLSGADGTAPQFWIGYTPQPGYEGTDLSGLPTHVDFYNGDDTPDC